MSDEQGDHGSPSLLAEFDVLARIEGKKREAEQRPINDDSLRAQIGEIGNQCHNLSCEHQDNDDLRDRLGSLASRLWRIQRQVRPVGTHDLSPAMESLYRNNVIVNGALSSYFRGDCDWDQAMESAVIALAHDAEVLRDLVKRRLNEAMHGGDDG